MATQAGAVCVNCHRDMQQGLAAAHAPLAQNCVLCHAGDASATDAAVAHHGLIAFPGDMDSASQVCGNCHADKVDGVTHSLMHTGTGMVAKTRVAFGEQPDHPGHNDLQHLSHSPADSLLRKSCASCHLGQKKTAHRLDATHDRGGGCLACHINDQSSPAHPALSAQVSDARCFGCHSRSSRISLNYAGIAETDTSGNTRRLDDGRSIELRPADQHHAAGMACIDCHTEKDLMGIATSITPATRQQAVDIRCNDCHRITYTIIPAQWPDAYPALLPRIPYPVSADSHIPVTTNGTPLWHIELQGERAWLHTKLGGERLPIPPFRDSDHPLAQQHERLSCSACHSQWAPQCYSCHLEYNPAETQYDHIAGHITQGSWSGERSGVRNTLPPLGVNADNTIVPVVPGMIMTVTHPDRAKPRFSRGFAAIEPHTTGPARSCASCHRSSSALGLGEGDLVQSGAQWMFKPDMKILADGLAADAWTDLEQTPQAGGANATRAFNHREIENILAVPMPPASKADSAHKTDGQAR